MLREITSKDNSLIKFVRQFSKPAFGKKQDLILVEGFRQVEEALNSGVEIVHAFITSSSSQNENWSKIQPFWDDLKKNKDCVILPDYIMKSICLTENPQGIVLVCKSPVITVSKMENMQYKPAAKGLYMILEGLQDPGNMGSIIRSADAFDYNGIILTNNCVWPFNEKALRASMGSCFHLPFYEFENIRQAVKWLKTTETIVWAADPKGLDLTLIREDYCDQTNKNMALIIGNEGKGLSADAIALADRTVRIPMKGKAESLNAAAAAAILAYEISLLI